MNGAVVGQSPYRIDPLNHLVCSSLRGYPTMSITLNVRSISLFSTQKILSFKFFKMSFLKWLSWFYGFSTTHPTTHHSIIESCILELWLESFLWTGKKFHGIQLSQGSTWLFGDLIDTHHDPILGLFQPWNSMSFWIRRGYKSVGVITHIHRERVSPNTLFFNVSKMNNRRPLKSGL
jgi:hypothetical protein